MATTQAVRVHQAGGPEQLRFEPVEIAAPAAGQVQIRQTAIGLNYIDVYDRTGLYPMPMPATLGREAAGVVEAVGPKVKGLRRGDRVAYVLAQPGAYCALRNVPAERVVKIPAGVSDEVAAAAMLKGLTAEYLLRRTYRVKRGDVIVVHAAAGGVGLLLCQWGRALGATVIGVVGSEAKAQLARRHGAKHTFVMGSGSLPEFVAKVTRGAKASVVYDSVGKDTLMDSLDCLRPLGMCVTYGNASGPPPAIAPLELSKRGSLFLTRPSLFNYIAARKDLETAARALFAVIKSRKVKVRIGQRYALSEAAQAHRDLEARKTTGSTVLVP